MKYKVAMFFEMLVVYRTTISLRSGCIYRVILSVLDQRKCEYLKEYSLDFEHVYMTTYLASRKACRY